MEEEKKHTSTQYERELQEIKEGLLYLGALTEKAIERAIKSLLERDTELARKVIAMTTDRSSSIWKSRKNASVSWP